MKTLKHDYFSLFGLEKKFDIKIPALEKAYFAKQREFHPDRQSGKNLQEKQQAILDSMEYNQAYQTLKNPLLRLQHLLALHGIIINTDSNDTVKPKQELLVEMMEMRERLDQCQNAVELSELEHYEKQETQTILEHLPSVCDDSDWQHAALLALRLRYLEKLREELRIVRNQRFLGKQ